MIFRTLRNCVLVGGSVSLHQPVLERTDAKSDCHQEDIRSQIYFLKIYVLHSGSYRGFAVFPGSILCRRMFIIREVCNNSLLDIS